VEPNQSEVTLKQEHRLIEINIQGVEKDELVLEAFSGTEEISRPYEFKLRLLSTKLNVDMQELLRKQATVTLQLSGDSQKRYFHGSFASFRQTEQVQEDLVVYEAVLVPSIWFLSLDQDCRIFQNQSVPEIVEAVLKGAGITDFNLKTTKSYPKREYCVQYRESNLNFISRLLEEEGIFYYSVHEETKHTITFHDHSEGLESCPYQPKAACGFTQEALGPEDLIWNFDRLEQVHTGKVTLRDYDFEKPRNSLETTVSGSGKDKEEIYNYPGSYVEQDDGYRYARLRLEEREGRQLVVDGTSRCRAFCPGYSVKVQNHYRKDTNGDYVLISVSHEILDTTYRSSQNAAHTYQNSFRVIPKATPYRPPLRTIKPVVQGSQTAVVVGPNGDEIWVDKYGRVKVQFHWDRIGKKDENSSCWVRVAQTWAGKNWGWVTIPRMGQEVLIDFLEGDPDRPIITGRVYNADQMPPYTLPDNQTQSGIKSRSSKEGGSSNYNEIRFEDLKGSEMITIHAEKDMETEVEHDDSQKVQNDRTIKVDGKHTETITKDMSITITQGNRSLTLNQGNESTTLDMGNQTITLKMGNQTTKLDLGKSETEAMQSIELKVGQSSIKIDQMGVTIKGMMITVDGQIMTEVKAGAILTAKGAITMIN
jgi:type VI secretion system secreted protein VgrG